MELKIDWLTKQYKNRIAVDRVSFELGKGVTGLLGANGAGKTTLMRMICGILMPTAGLDPKERVRFRNLIEDIGQDSIVLLSTHVVSDVEHIADRVLMMKSGQIIWNGKWSEADGSLEDFYLKEFGEEEQE